MLISSIFKNVKCININNYNKDVKIEFISSNSKLIRRNSIFVTNFYKKIKPKYIKEAKKKGAVAILTNKIIKNINIPQFEVRNINSNLTKILNKLNKKAPNNIIGITGTNGKTSVVWIISHILKLCNYQVTSYGTLGLYKNLKKVGNSSLTTPEREELHQLAFSSLSKYNSEFVFEVSSHGISKRRIRDFPINIAAITNLSQDHLDFHKTFINYKNTKFKLFKKHLLNNGIAILNDNIKNINKLKKELKIKNIKVISYGKYKSDISCVVYKKNKIRLKIYNKYYLIDYQFISKFELDNLSCSIGCCLAIGLNITEIIKIVSKVKRAHGRMEFVAQLKNGSKVFVDYAHTPDALKNILISMIFKKKKPDLVFGCGGNRDKSKRIKMGEIANKYANKIYITDDNPRDEDPRIIRKTIYSKCNNAKEIDNRKIAIKEAIENLNSNSILIIAGKGHEKKQIFSNKIIPFDDVKVAKFYVNKFNKNV